MLPPRSRCSGNGSYTPSTRHSPGQRGVVVLSAGRVEAPVLAHTVFGICVALGRVVRPARACGTDFQHEVRRLAHLVDNVSVAVQDGAGVDAKGYDAIGNDPARSVMSITAKVALPPYKYIPDAR